MLTIYKERKKIGELSSTNYCTKPIITIRYSLPICIIFLVYILAMEQK